MTDPVRTVIDCARRLPFGEALTIADSALRQGGLTRETLVEAAGRVRGQGAVQCRRVAHEASHLASNPFESMTRALARDVGLAVRPQVEIELPGVAVHPDLVDVRRRLVIECDGYMFHGNDALVFERDVWRYTTLTALGWTVLRFAHRHVFKDDTWARWCLETYL